VREVVLERGLLTEAELDDIFSAQNLMHPAIKRNVIPMKANSNRSG
jgi:aspartate ammonia-lyase